uniref:DNA/RNA non-specific endonuclease domain-containing protein n=1 Tax=Pygocentrus nattereri TaxID=42514 RepID=A0AAR2LTE4_PYGNA
MKMWLQHPLILLLAFSSLASCRLVDDFLATPPNGCPQFFLNTPNGHVTPTILQPAQRYQRICQEYLGLDRFATLYDTQNRIPVYSAYLHVPHTQIDTMRYQCLDYLNSGMDKGHLYPSYHNNDVEGMDATFSLTNAAPQARSFRTQWFGQVEYPANELIQIDCGSNTAYVVTGVVPDRILTISNNRVRVASHFWTAYCCLDNSGNVIGHGAFLMDQYGDMLLKPNQNVQDLENLLKLKMIVIHVEKDVKQRYNCIHN